MAKGLIYVYFESKEDLLNQILISGFGKVSYEMFVEDMSDEEYVTAMEHVFESMSENKDFFKLYTALSVQPSVSRKLAALTDSQNRTSAILKLYKRKYGEGAMKELLLTSALIKGFSVMYLFGDGQNVFPIELLKTTVLDYIRIKFNIDKK